MSKMDHLKQLCERSCPGVHMPWSAQENYDLQYSRMELPALLTLVEQMQGSLFVISGTDEPYDKGVAKEALAAFEAWNGGDMR